MADNKINLLQVTAAKSWAGLTTENHLVTAFMEQPQLISDVISRVFGNNSYFGLSTILAKMGTKTVDTDREYEWMLKGDDRKAIMIQGYEANGSTSYAKPGISKSMFKLILKENFFKQSDELFFDNNEYSVRIMNEPYSDGMNWVYEVRHTEPDMNWFIPPALMATGKKVSKKFSSQESTLGRTYGSTSFTSPFKMRNFFTTLSKEMVVPANMHGRPVIISMTDPTSNKTTKIWTQYAEWEMLAQWEREKDNALIFSRYNQNSDGTFDLKGDSAFPVMKGAGMRQQISPAYKFKYSKFSLDYLTDVLLGLSINILPEDQRNFVALTGERGMVQFSKALEAKAAQYQPLDSKRIFGSGQELGFGGQYVEYRGPQGLKFTLVNLPQYNDAVDNRDAHPDGGFTENYRYTILNFGTTEGEPNITRIYPKNGNKMWHVAGSTSPYGPKKSFSEAGASKIDGYELMIRTTQGLMIKNPMSCAELIYEGVA